MRLLFLSYFLATNVFANQWGQEIKLKQSIELAKVVKNYEQYKNNEVLVKAKVGKVCAKKGCWMQLESSSDQQVRVTFKDYAFFVPLSLIGQQVLVQGRIQSHQMTLEETKHYAQDAGLDPSKVKKAEKEYRMIASGVRKLN